MVGVASIWRHPIKSHGREALDSVELTQGQTMPWDRCWAVTHDQADVDLTENGWARCGNFMRGASAPSLNAIDAKLDSDSGTLTLSHPDVVPLTFKPNDPNDQAAFLDWVTPLCPANRRQPTALVASPSRGITDSPEPSVSIMTMASLKAVADRVGQPMDVERMRGNIYLDGPAAWDENDWVGKRIRIGTAVLLIDHTINRCMLTAANPTTGKRDADVLGALRDGWDHQIFGVNGVVVQSGTICVGDSYEVL